MVFFSLLRNSTCHKVRSSRLSARNLPLDAGVARVGPGQYPQYTRADFGLEALGSSAHKHHTSPNDKPHGRVKSRMVAEPCSNLIMQLLRDNFNDVDLGQEDSQDR